MTTQFTQSQTQATAPKAGAGVGARQTAQANLGGAAGGGWTG